MTSGLIGMMDTPAQGNVRLPDVPWAADNGCFGKGYPGDAEWLTWLKSTSPAELRRCLFAVAPDVVGDAQATWERSAPFLPAIRRLGYPAALVGQNGMEHLTIDWGAFDALFIGGDTAWKLGPAARALAEEAKRRSKWLHMGRVNSWRRFEYARYIGCDSVDGTFLAFGPNRNLPLLRSWIVRAASQATLEFE